MKPFSPKLPCLVLLDKIILVVFWNDATRLVLNLLFDSYYIFVEENIILRKKVSWSEISPMVCIVFLLRCILGPRAFLLRRMYARRAFLTRSCYEFYLWRGWGPELRLSKLSLGWWTRAIFLYFLGMYESLTEVSQNSFWYFLPNAFLKSSGH